MSAFELKIDESLCWGCKTCEAACKQENRAPVGVKLVRVTDGKVARDESGKLGFSFRVERCRHCENPPCAEVCPVEAIVKRPDAVVVLDQTACIGCRACVDACPYASIEFDEAAGTAKKCNLCHHRLDAGLLPACADNVCLAHCITLLERG